MRSPAPVSSRHGNRLNGRAFSRHCNRPIGISPAPRVCWGSSGRTFISVFVPSASARSEGVSPQRHRGAKARLKENYFARLCALLLVPSFSLFCGRFCSKRSPLLVRRGGCASKKKMRSHRSGAAGVVAYEQHFTVSDHPVRSNKVASRHFLDVAAAT